MLSTVQACTKNRLARSTPSLKSAVGRCVRRRQWRTVDQPRVAVATFLSVSCSWMSDGVALTFVARFGVAFVALCPPSDAADQMLDAEREARSPPPALAATAARQQVDPKRPAGHRGDRGTCVRHPVTCPPPMPVGRYCAEWA